MVYPNPYGPRHCRRCDPCDVNWPDLLQFKVCPECEKPTSVEEGTAIHPGVAADRVLEYTRATKERRRIYDEFEAFYLRTRLPPLIAELASDLEAWCQSLPGEWGN